MRDTIQDNNNGIVDGLRAVVRAATELTKSIDLDALYRHAVEFALRELNVERCAIFIVEDPGLRGTFGTNMRGEVVDEHSQQFPIEEIWKERISKLHPHGPAWSIIEGVQNEWDGEKAVLVGTGWVVITPIFAEGVLAAVFINDSAITNKPLDPVVQEVIAVYCSLFGNIVQRRKADLNLEKERNLLRTLIDTLPDLIYVKDVDSRLIVVNAAHAQNANVSLPDDLIGKNDFDLFPAELAASYFADDQAIIGSGNPLINREEMGPDRDGNTSWGLTTKIPLRDKDGQVIGIVGLTRDITQLKEAQAALQRSNDELEARVQRRVADLARANQALEKEIDERLSTEKELQHERNLLRTVIDHAPDQIYVKDLESRFILASLNCAEVIGIENAESLIGKSDRDLYPPEMAAKFYEDEQKVITSGVPLISREETNVNKDGVQRWFLTTKVPLRDSGGRVTGIVGISRDITERKNAEKLIRQSEELFSKAFHASPLAICTVAIRNGEFIDVNNRYLELTGFDRSELIGKSSLEIPITPDNRQQLEILERITQEQRICDYEAQMQTKAGKLRDVLFTFELTKIDGELCILAMAEDTTVRKQMQKTLMEERKLLRTLLDALPDYIFVKDRTGRFILSNLAHARGAGVTDPNDFSGKTAADFYPPELAQQYDADDQAVMDSGKPLISVERTTLDAFGKPMHVSTTKVPLLDEQGGIVGLVGISRDMTQRHRAENILRDSEERYRSLFELSPDGIIVCYEQRIVYANHAAGHLFRADGIDDLLGRSLDEVMSAQQIERLHAAAAARSDANGTVAALETQLVQLTGQSIDVEMMAAPVSFANLPGIQIIIRDVSERLQAELVKRESERLRVALEKEKELRDLKSKLMVTISHEFRTPMTIAQSSADILEDYFERMSAEKRREHLAKIISQIQLLTEMMEDINFVIQASFEDLSLKIEPINLKQLCQTIIGEMQTSGDVFHRIVLQGDDDIPPLTLDLRRIKYVITNLLSNAMKYSDHDTSVSLTLRRADNNVVISVKDEGIGISDDEQARIFEPFYRGQNVGVIRGSGIGLSIVKEIVDQHKGTIHIESALAAGTIVTIMLPLSQNAPGEA